MRKVSIVAKYRRAKQEDDWTIVYPVLLWVLGTVGLWVSIYMVYNHILWYSTYYFPM